MIIWILEYRPTPSFTVIFILEDQEDDKHWPYTLSMDEQI